ncbi:hypothetical protein ACUXV3_20475 (plasmid) [Roseobacteraceae bacterium NS-SX3]
MRDLTAGSKEQGIAVTAYNKTLAPPPGEPFLETPDGLKYWLVKHGPGLGLQRSVITEDASISMHAYSGNREDGGAYLFCFKGFQIGFFCQRVIPNYGPMPDLPPERDLENNAVTIIVTGVGVPVFDEGKLLLRDENGNAARDERGIPKRNRNVNPESAYVTGLSWNVYNRGVRDKFQSRRQQEEMLALWPDFFTGLTGKLSRLKPSGRPDVEIKMRFSEDVQKALDAGELADG